MAKLFCGKCKTSKDIYKFYKSCRIKRVCIKCSLRIVIKWKLENPKNLAFSTYKYNAKRRKIKFSLTFDEFVYFWKKPCTYCNFDIHTIGLDRFNNSLGYVEGNIVPCCSWCNSMKRNFTSDEFLSQVTKIYKQTNKKTWHKQLKKQLIT